MNSFGLYLVGALLGIGIGSLSTYLLLTSPLSRRSNNRANAQAPISISTTGKFALKYDPGLVASFIAPEQFSSSIRASQSNVTIPSTKTAPNLDCYTSPNRPEFKGDTAGPIMSPAPSREFEPVSNAHTDLTQWIGTLSSVRDNIEKEVESIPPLPNGFRN
jgi:hypothetical protein